MRPLEILSLSAFATILVIVAIPWSKRPRETRFLPVIPALTLLLQLAVEGYRWQMVPAYALGTTLFLIGLRSLIKGYQPAGGSGRVVKAPTIAGSLLGLAIVWITVELCVQLPVFRMPEPGGPYSVGTRTFLLVDESRPDRDSPLQNGFRTLSVQAWYPADLTGEEERSTYIQRDIRNEMAELDGPPAFYLGHLDHICTYAYGNAKIARDAEQVPVILYSPSGNASLHKILFEEVASQGYLVISISHPHWNNVLFDDQGEVIPQGGVSERYQTWFGEENSSAVQTAKGQILAGGSIGLLEQAQTDLNFARPIAIAELREWANDAGFVLDQLAAMNQPGEFFEGRIDLSRIGVMGFSLGGATAGQFCVSDARCRAGINVDGFMFGDILEKNLDIPFMFIHSGYPEVESVGALFYQWAEDSAYLLQIGGTNHRDLGAPAPTGKPILLDMGVKLGQFPDGAYLAQIMNDYILSFFDKHLRSESARLLDGPSPYPEVLFTKKAGN